jgi:HAD superfamily hydrolase (TIGR01509 family)
VSAVVFDMDGLMVDTEPLYQSAWQQAASEAGYELDDELYSRFVGRPTHACEAILQDEFGSSFPLDRFRERWPDLWQQQVQRVGIQLKPGLIELLDFVDSQQLPAAVATSSEKKYADITLLNAGVLDRFKVVITGDRVDRGKPAPDIYLEAARQLRMTPSECVAFEDSEAGIQAVQRAGMIGLLVPHWPASADAARAAFAVVGTLIEARHVLASLIRGDNRASRGHSHRQGH